MSEERKVHRYEWVQRETEFLKKQSTPEVMKVKIPRNFAKYGLQCTPSKKLASEFNSVSYDEANDGKRLFAHQDTSHSMEDERGWKFLGCGVHKCAFEFKEGCVVKFARGGQEGVFGEHFGNYDDAVGNFGMAGGASNAYEAASYTIAPEDVKPFLVPIVAYAPKDRFEQVKWLVVPKARTEKNDSLDDHALQRIEEEINVGLDEAGASCRDIHPGNVGLLDRYPVMIDYGFSITCKRTPTKRKTKPKTRRLSEFEVAQRSITVESPSTLHCTHHYECPTRQVCIKSRCKHATEGDIINEVKSVADQFRGIPYTYRSEIKFDLDDALDAAERLKNEGEFYAAIWKVDEAKHQIEALRERLDRIGVSWKEKGT